MARHRSVPYLGRYTFVVDDSSDKKLDRYQKKPVIAKDYSNGSITIYSSFTEAGEKTGVKSGTIRYRIVNKVPGLFHGYVFKDAEDVDSLWPEFSPEEICQSVKERIEVH